MSIGLNPSTFVKSKIPYFVGVNKADIVGDIFQGYNPKAVPEIKVNGKTVYINPLLRSTYTDDSGVNIRFFYTKRLPFFPFNSEGLINGQYREKLTYKVSDSNPNSGYLTLSNCNIAETTKNPQSTTDNYQSLFPSVDKPLSNLLSFYVRENATGEYYKCSNDDYYEGNFVPNMNEYIYVIDLQFYFSGIELYFHYDSRIDRWKAALNFYMPGEVGSRVNLLDFTFEVPLDKTQNFGYEIKKRKCALGYTRVDHGDTNLSGTWIFVQLDLPNLSTTSFVGVFIPDNAFENDGTTIRKIKDEDIRIVTEYDKDKVSCIITGKGTDWEQVQTYLEYMRGTITIAGKKEPISSIKSSHHPRDRQSPSYNNPMVIWYKN